jgi:hypothetical protein
VTSRLHRHSADCLRTEFPGYIDGLLCNTGQSPILVKYVDNIAECLRTEYPGYIEGLLCNTGKCDILVT